ncbi:MAG: glycine--tRNA ligase [Nitrososphaerota archaeon]
MQNRVNDVLDLAKRRGFFWAAYETYGGSAGLYVLGDLGVKLMNNVEELWRDTFVRPHDFVEVDTPSLMPMPLLEASGHVANFKDPMAECLNCHRKYRADHLLSDAGKKIQESLSIEQIKKELTDLAIRCPECGSTSWEVKPFLTMFETRIGPYADNIAYLRPETAQGIFVEFNRLFQIERSRIPIGIAQIGRGFRNEISPRQGIIRLREFHMLELELFMDPNDTKCKYIDEVLKEELYILDERRILQGEMDAVAISIMDALASSIIKTEWLAYFMALSQRFLQSLGVPREKQRFVEKITGERAHYSAQTFDHEVFMYELGWIEVAGHAYRTDYDLTSHMKKTGAEYTASVQLDEPQKVKRRVWSIDVQKLKEREPVRWKEVMKEYSNIKDRTNTPPQSIAGIAVDPSFIIIKEEEVMLQSRKFIPHVVEPSFGGERVMLACLLYAYDIRDKRNVMHLPYRLAPIKAGVFPLVNKLEMEKTAQQIYSKIKKAGIPCIYDDSGSIGRRYARVDEIGTPFAVTVDDRTLQDSTVTIRERDTWKQRRVNQESVVDELLRNSNS